MVQIPNTLLAGQCAMEHSNVMVGGALLPRPFNKKELPIEVNRKAKIDSAGEIPEIIKIEY